MRSQDDLDSGSSNAIGELEAELLRLEGSLTQMQGMVNKVVSDKMKRDLEKTKEASKSFEEKSCASEAAGLNELGTQGTGKDLRERRLSEEYSIRSDKPKESSNLFTMLFAGNDKNETKLDSQIRIDGSPQDQGVTVK